MSDFTGPAKRCVCLTAKPERINDHIIGCCACGGWFAIEVSSPDELERFRRTFPSAAAD